METTHYLELLRLAAPETIVVLAALAVLFVDLTIMGGEPRRHRLQIGAGITAFGCAAAILWIANIPAQGNVHHGMLVVDPLTQLVKQVLLVLAVLTALVSVESSFTDHVGEYFALLLLATVGMMFLVSSEEILMIFVSLELTSLSLYILAAFNKHSAQSAEAALKYFFFGGMAAAFTLFGLSLVYGVSGETNLVAIAAALKGRALDPLLAVALALTVIGFGFKIAAVPFHLWAPDTYEGAPVPCAAFIASGSKVASFFVFGKVMMLGFAGLEGGGAWGRFTPGWIPVLATLALGSMLVGNLGALAQAGLKRLLAYSAIAHAGYLLLGLMALGFPAQRHEAMAALVYYLATYGLTALGAFAIVAAVDQEGQSDRLTSLAGLSQRAPFLALCLMIFLLSLAGIPPLPGFFGKFYLFTAATAAEPASLGLLWLVVAAIALSALSLYYYLRVLKQAYVAAEASESASRRVALTDRIAVGVLALAVIVLGITPDFLLARLTKAIAAAGL